MAFELKKDELPAEHHEITHVLCLKSYVFILLSGKVACAITEPVEEYIFRYAVFYVLLKLLPFAYSPSPLYSNL